VNKQELEDKLRETYVSDVTGEKKHRTLEDALQEALDNTTPELPGAPNTSSAYEIPEEQDEPEWI
jgi:hypothetical protein